MPENTRSSELRDILKAYGFFVLNDKSQDKHVRKKALDNAVNELEALIASKVRETEKRSLLEGVRIGANHVGETIKEVVKDYDKIGDSISNSVLAALQSREQDKV